MNRQIVLLILMFEYFCERARLHQSKTLQVHITDLELTKQNEKCREKIELCQT